MNDMQRYLSLRLAAGYAGVSTGTLQKMVRDGRLRECRLPGVDRVLIDREQLDRLLAGQPAGERR